MADQWLDLAYDDYHAWKGWKNEREAQGEVARAITELQQVGIDPPARLLEVGFGDGAVLRRAQQLGYACAGLERSQAQTESLSSLGIEIYHGEVSQLAGRTFDIIAAFDVFEHVQVPELIAMLRDLASLLAPDGRLLARFPNMASPFGLVNQFGDITHVTGLSPSSFAQLARMAGLETIAVTNGATVLRGGRGLRQLIKPVSFVTRKIIEAVLSFAYYGKMTPLSPSVVVIMRKGG